MLPLPLHFVPAPLVAYLLGAAFIGWRRNEEAYRALFEDASDAIAFAGTDLKILEANPRLAELCGYSREELVGIDFRELLEADDLERLPAHKGLGERRLRRKDGSFRTAEVSVRALRGNLVIVVCREATARSEANKRPAAAIPERKTANETILLAEDEGSLRRLIRDVLQRQGYRVLEAQDPLEALQVCREHTERIHLLLTDVVMPKMGGRDLADRAVVLRPDLKVLYMSGYTDDMVLRRGVEAAGSAFLQKPFAPGKLVDKVR